MCKVSLDFTNYYRQFIPNYAQVAKPLYTLISGENASKKNNFIKWNEECEQAFRKLKNMCTSAPILAYADFTKLFKLQNDVCGLSIEALLYQN